MSWLGAMLGLGADPADRVAVRHDLQISSSRLRGVPTWFRKIGQSIQLCPEPLKGCEMAKLRKSTNQFQASLVLEALLGHNAVLEIPPRHHLHANPLSTCGRGRLSAEWRTCSRAASIPGGIAERVRVGAPDLSYPASHVGRWHDIPARGCADDVSCNPFPA